MHRSRRHLDFCIMTLIMLCAYPVSSTFGGIVSPGISSSPTSQFSDFETAFETPGFIGRSAFKPKVMQADLSLDLFGVEQPNIAPPEQLAAEQNSLRELPPAPSSMSLVLSALATLGAYQGARSIKRIHWNFTPEWYDENAVPIGHITPLCLDFEDLPVCEFETPRPAPLAVVLVATELIPPLISQYILPTRIPRGPPCFSCMF